MATPTKSPLSRTLPQSIVKLILLSSSAIPLLGTPIINQPSPIQPKNTPFSILYGHYLTHPAGSILPLAQLERSSPQFWYMMAVIVVLVLLGGCFAGLTLGASSCLVSSAYTLSFYFIFTNQQILNLFNSVGLMGLDILNLRVLSTSGSPTEQLQAQKVLKLLERGRHWVLVVLLLSNVVVNETLPIFLLALSSLRIYIYIPSDYHFTIQ